MKIEAIIFDKDGTLFDFQATWAAPILDLLDRMAPGSLRAPAAAALGIDPTTGRFRHDSVVIASTTAEVAATLAPVVAREPGEIVATLDRIGQTARLMPAVPLRPCLAALKVTYRLGLVTNDSEQPARTHLAEEDVLDLFEFVAGYDSGFGAKPAPGQLLAFAKATGIAPARTVMVGDSRHDLAAARAAGAIPVGVLTGPATTAELEDLAEAILPDIGHLGDWLGARGR